MLSPTELNYLSAQLDRVARELETGKITPQTAAKQMRSISADLKEHSS